MDQFGKWASRTFRHYSTVHPPYSVGFDPSATRKDKLRFVHNIWAAQALARTKVLPTQVKAVPQVLESPEEVDLGPAKEPFSVAKLYSNIWDREGWEAEHTKVGWLSIPALTTRLEFSSASTRMANSRTSRWAAAGIRVSSSIYSLWLAVFVACRGSYPTLG